MMRPNWLTMRELQDHWRALMMDACYFEAQPDTWGLRVRTAIEVAKRTLIALGCEWRGHDLVAETFAPESGGETLTCKRCGWSQDVWH